MFTIDVLLKKKKNEQNALPLIDEGEEGAGNVDETSAQEEFEEKLKDCVEGLTQKRYRDIIDLWKYHA